VFKRWRILALFFLLAGLANLIRARMAFYVTPALEGYALSVPLRALGGFYLGWGVLFGAIAILFWLRRALSWAIPVAVVYQVTLWTLRIFAYRSEYARALWTRDLVIAVLFMVMVMVLVSDKGRET